MPPSNPFCFIDSPVSGNLSSLCARVPLCLVASDVALNVGDSLVLVVASLVEIDVLVLCV